MNSKYQKQLQKNIVKYSWYKIFTKRVFLPLITIQLVSVGQVTLEQIALIAIITSIVQAVLQMPAGYLADKIGNRKAILLGSWISLTSPLFYAFMPNFWGGLIASVLFFGGYAFQSGSIEAFMHNTLIALKREKDYAKVMGRAQTYGLVGNIFLVALVPLTYSINHTLPFIIGFLSLVGMLWLAYSFVHPPVDVDPKRPPKSPLRAIKSIVTAQNVTLFIFAGFMAGVSNKGGEFRELLLQDIGVAVGLFGFIVALSSLVGAVMGWYVHILDKLRPLSFYFLDLVLITGCLVVVGLTDNPVVAIAGFTLYGGYTRVRTIIFQAKMLHEIQHVYKATLISALNLFNLIGDIIAITLLTTFVTRQGYLPGYVTFGLAIFLIGLALWSLMFIEARVRGKRTAQ
ncbi:MAG: MFS transporter [Candidatus Microsaccharimonas sp.]